MGKIENPDFDEIFYGYESLFDEFIESVDSYYESAKLLVPPKSENDLGLTEHYKYCQQEVERLLNIIHCACSKEFKWDEEYVLYGKRMNGYGASILVEIESADFEYSFGFFRGMYSYYDIKYPNNIKKAEEPFFHYLATLYDIGRFDFSGGKNGVEKVIKKYPNLKNPKNPIFKLIRDYMITQIEFGESRNFGGLRVQWNWEGNKKELITSLLKSIYIYYQLNEFLQ